MNAPRRLSECFDIAQETKPWFADYPINVIESAWLSDSEIDALSGELKFIAQSLRSIRNRDFSFSPQGTMRHAREVLTLLAHITGESAYAAMREKVGNGEETNMCEIMEEFRAHYRAQGFEQGVVCGEQRGEKRGIEIGEQRGEKRGIEIGEQRGEQHGKVQGSFNRLLDMTKRIMSHMGKTLEDAMSYLQLTDEEKHQVRQAF